VALVAATTRARPRLRQFSSRMLDACGPAVCGGSAGQGAHPVSVAPPAAAPAGSPAVEPLNCRLEASQAPSPLRRATRSTPQHYPATQTASHPRGTSTSAHQIQLRHLQLAPAQVGRPAWRRLESRLSVIGGPVEGAVIVNRKQDRWGALGSAVGGRRRCHKLPDEREAAADGHAGLGERLQTRGGRGVRGRRGVGWGWG
jgi:hypothetical protein